MSLNEIRDAFQRDLKNERDDLMRLVNQIHAGEHKRRLRRKEYYIVRIVSYYDRVKTEYREYIEAVRNYLRQESDINSQKVTRRGTWLKGSIDSFIEEAIEDIKPIQDILDSARLADKFAMAIDMYGRRLKSLIVDDPRSHDSTDLVKYNGEMESSLAGISPFIEDLQREISSTQ